MFTGWVMSPSWMHSQSEAATKRPSGVVSTPRRYAAAPARGSAGPTVFDPRAPVTRGVAARSLHALAMNAAAWSPSLRAAPPSTVCFRVGDPAALG